MRRSHVVSLIVVTVLSLGSFIAVLAASWTPVLGVQLQGGVEVALRPAEEVDDETLDLAIEIIRNRIDGFGVAEPDITRQGQQIVVQIPGVDDQDRAVDLIGRTAELQFRPVVSAFLAEDPQQRLQAQQFAEALSGLSLDAAAGDGTDDLLPVDDSTNPATATTGNIDAPDTSEPAEDADADAAPDTSTAGSAVTTTAAPTTAAPTTSAPTATTAAGEADSNADGGEDDEAGSLLTATTVPAAPTTTEFDPSTAPDLDELLTRADEAQADESVLFINQDGSVVYLLGPTEVSGSAVDNAVATFNGEWLVSVDFTEQGSGEFDAMAARYYSPDPNAAGAVAIAVDGTVISAPRINAPSFDGTAVITGAFDEDGAKDLGLALRYGALPTQFEFDDVRTVSATLGDGTLQAGVIAGAIGLLLVAIYMIFYYRLLGLVAVASLVVSGAILWSIIAFLGEQQGLALTLAGTTGIIVSIGVAVDSNIVYYERIKEEVRRGRAIRSASDNSFRDAFMTIIWADLASLIGAFILWTLTTGSVKGFALYLGLATAIDLFVSYFFMRPMVVFLTRQLIDERPSRIGMTSAVEAG